MPGFDFGLHASACFSLTASPPSFPPRTVSRMSLLRQGVVARSDWSFPSSPTPLAAIHLLPIRDQAQSAAGLAGDRTQIPTHLTLTNYATFTMMSHITCIKGVTTHLYGGTYNQYGGFVRPWLFDDYHILVLLLPTSLTTAGSNRVQTSPTLPSHQSPRHQDSKIPHSIYRLSTRFLLLSSGK